MGNAAAGGLEQEPAENSAGSASGMSDPAPVLQKKQPAPPKLPMPPEEELEERFNVVLVSDGKGLYAPPACDVCDVKHFIDCVFCFTSTMLINNCSIQSWNITINIMLLMNFQNH